MAPLCAVVVVVVVVVPGFIFKLQPGTPIVPLTPSKKQHLRDFLLYFEVRD